MAFVQQAACYTRAVTRCDLDGSLFRGRWLIHVLIGAFMHLHMTDTSLDRVVSLMRPPGGTFAFCAFCAACRSMLHASLVDTRSLFLFSGKRSALTDVMPFEMLSRDATMPSPVLTS